MAWIDDRIWCHPKITSLSDSAFRTYIQAITFSAGMGTGGHLDPSQIKLVSSKKRDENELISARLWDENGSGIVIHDWAEHNAKRDERRAADRERKRLSRAKNEDLSAGQAADTAADSPEDIPWNTSGPVRRTDSGQTSGPAHVDLLTE